ncbi:hypothetical protein [Cellulosimicrobium sp. Marseille-Q4280]|uniref:hypothetical protein n=1 Tax=Cellulosimicrobium sp. Marseille-Q4280 TaxID=2937992 RepID=UPI00203EB01F|nr:hypothetical protein [Cellulosimicrobium sp. Marseille-Q4280]
MTINGFDETAHPRERTGRFAEKPVSEPAGELGAGVDALLVDRGLAVAVGVEDRHPTSLGVGRLDVVLQLGGELGVTFSAAAARVCSASVAVAVMAGTPTGVVVTFNPLVGPASGKVPASARETVVEERAARPAVVGRGRGVGFGVVADDEQ